MQHFRGKLSKAINEGVFLGEWEANRQLNRGPHTEVCFCGADVTVIIDSGLPWAPGNFRQTFQLVLHKVDPHCDVSWDEPEISAL